MFHWRGRQSDAELSKHLTVVLAARALCLGLLICVKSLQKNHASRNEQHQSQVDSWGFLSPLKWVFIFFRTKVCLRIMFVSNNAMSLDVGTPLWV